MARWRRYTKWTMLAVTLATATIFVASGFVGFLLPNVVQIEAGYIILQSGNPAGSSMTPHIYRTQDLVGIERFYGWYSAPRRNVFWRPAPVTNRPNARILFAVTLIPAWIVTLLLTVPTALLFWCDRNRHLPGHCPACNYDLTANESGVCPECGTEV